MPVAKSIFEKKTPDNFQPEQPSNYIWVFFVDLLLFFRGGGGGVIQNKSFINMRYCQGLTRISDM